ncbi:hypothetical protein WJX81_007785 [Elliptochloris bilobata]|uniref:Acyl-coenzyme A thioesterase 13 n=1 Tax=Elliptochloris bilobata TaxID=381761 RepID=A0AAW1S6T9_9CHLO
MGTVEAGKLFLEALTCAGEQPDLNAASNFDTTALNGLKDIRATPGHVVCTLPVSKRVQNRYTTLHGGCIATLVDTVTSAALVTVSKRSGVSLGIGIDYLSPGTGGEEVEIDARVVKVGRTVATINADIRMAGSGRLVAQGRHTKFLPADEQEVKGLPRAKL